LPAIASDRRTRISIRLDLIEQVDGRAALASAVDEVKIGVSRKRRPSAA